MEMFQNVDLQLHWTEDRRKEMSTTDKDVIDKGDCEGQRMARKTYRKGNQIREKDERGNDVEG